MISPPSKSGKLQPEYQVDTAAMVLSSMYSGRAARVCRVPRVSARAATLPRICS